MQICHSEDDPYSYTDDKVIINSVWFLTDNQITFIAMYSGTIHSGAFES